MPNVSSPSAKVASLPLIRGEPSRRNVARVLLVPASNRARTLAANSAASLSISCQLAMPRRYGLGTTKSEEVVAPDRQGEPVAGLLVVTSRIGKQSKAADRCAH